MNRRLLPALVSLFLFGKLAAQQFGAFPPSTNWQQLNTDSLRIIFPKNITPSAERIAAILQQMGRQNVNPLGSDVRKIHILLHPNTTLANGYVALAPFRSEYYLIPGSNIFEFGATPWIEELAVHEYRHVQQYSNFNKGLSKTVGTLFGQQGQALFNALAVPDWFFEGDAVHSETALTTQGRGRAPYFFNGFRALWADGRNYSWMKLRNGSLKDFVPNHYNLGYLITNYGYQQYGPNFWGKVTDDASRFRSLFYPFQKAVKRVSGQSFSSFQQEALDFYKKAVPVRADEKRRRETVADYLFPQVIGDDSLLYIKTAYNKIPAFYQKDKNGERRIKQRSLTNEDWLSYRNGIVAYTGYAPDPRWGLTDYSNIYLLDIKTGAEKRITSKQRYFTPDISPVGTQLVAVSFNDSIDTELHLLAQDGTVLRRIAPGNRGDLFVHPRFIDETSLVVAVRHADATMSLQRISWTEGENSAPEITMLVPPSPAVIGYPFVDGNVVYFVSSATGNDEIFSLDLDGALPASSVHQLTSGITGSYYPSVSSGTLYRSTFTSNGLRIEQSPVTAQQKVVPMVTLQNRVLPYPVSNDAATPNLLQTAGVATLPAQRYKKTTGLFNFHSRQVNYSDPEFTLSILSDNILNTFSNEIFYRYNQNESSHAAGFTSYYGGLYPVLRAGFTYTANRTLRTTTDVFTLDQKEARIGYYIPLNFTGGKTYKFLNFGTDYVYSETTPTGKNRSRINGRTAGYLSHSLTWSQQLPRAVQQLFPKFGYSFGLYHRHLLSQNGFQFLGAAGLILPSVKNHSLVVTANWQETDTSNVIFSNRFANSRGYNDYFFSRMWKAGVNYHMPLFYPDWGFGNMLYFLRVRTNLFYDYTKVFSKSKLASREQRSVGGEVYFDTRWWNMLPVSLGFRVSHLLDDDFSGQRPKGSNIFEVVIPVDIIPR